MALGDLLEVLEERFEFIPRVIRFRRISLGRGLELKCHAKVGLFTISDVMGRVFSAFVLISDPRIGNSYTRGDLHRTRDIRLDVALGSSCRCHDDTTNTYFFPQT